MAVAVYTNMPTFGDISVEAYKPFMITLVSGAASCGKSEIAETIAVHLSEGDPIYIATMRPYGDEDEARIGRHRRLRGRKRLSNDRKISGGVGTLRLPANATCLLECMSNLLANEMFGAETDDSAAEPTVKAESAAAERIVADIRRLSEQAENLIIVTNEVFSDTTAYDALCEQYIRSLGQINQAIAALADIVIESVAGIPIYHKGDAYAFL